MKEAAGGMKTILVADDKATSRELVRTVLEDSGYVVIEAGDGLETLRNARESKPDLILLDLHMPASTALAWSAKSGSIPNWPPRP